MDVNFVTQVDLKKKEFNIIIILLNEEKYYNFRLLIQLMCLKNFTISFVLITHSSITIK